MKNYNYINLQKTTMYLDIQRDYVLAAFFVQLYATYSFHNLVKQSEIAKPFK